jgi:type IV fimbrial biogenesis protein FimT
MSRVNGMTLFELMLALSIVAIAGTVAMPAFADLRRNAVRTATVNDFLHALYLARSEAINGMDVVSVCKSEDGQTCGNDLPDWAVGWLVFTNKDRDQPPQVDPDEPVLRTYSGWPQGHITANRPAFSFRPVQQNALNGTVLFCDSAGSSRARAIIISQTGRPRATNQTADGRPLTCP